MSHAFSRARRALLCGAVLAAAAVAAAPAAAIVRPTAPSADRTQLRPYFDVRVQTRQDLQRRGVTAVRRPSGAMRAARTSLRRSLGRQAYLSVDALTGTARVFTRTNGTLSGPNQGSARDVAWRFARSNATALGLSDADFSSFRDPVVRTSPSGITTVRWRQFAGGIPTYDNGLRVNLGRGNRVLSVQGSPVSGLDLGSSRPRLSAAAALRAFMANVNVRRDVNVTSRSTGVRRSTRFSTGDRARLVIFHTAGGDRLAWSLTYRAASAAWYEGVVDATSGRVLRRTNLTKNVVNAQVFDNYPGAPNGGIQRTQDIEPYLDPGAAVLSGPFARTYLDTNDNNSPQLTEEVAPGEYTFVDFTAAVGANGFCLPEKKCAWNPSGATRTSWTINKNQAAVQAHYFVSHFHDHLEQPAVGFTDSQSNFEEDDAVEVNANDGAETGPDLGHVDNANMSTPPDGISPLMQMYLFEPLNLSPAPGFEVPFRAINGDDSADILYHEYTHGLSNRLVVNDEGFGALSSPQSGAMGEAWSDWYAKDLLKREGFQIDSAGVDGEVDMGGYTDGELHTLRREALDCPVGGDADACPGGTDADGDGEPDTGTGGFTYGDFAVIGGGAEVHDDGEIWAQTLWDLRQALVANEGEDAGSDLAEQLVTDGMRLSPVEPTFLDMRNAILTADEAVNGGANNDLLWSVFADRGMGFFAGAVDGADVAPAENFAEPPAPGGPVGTVTGTVTDASSGLPVEGQRVGIAGHTSETGFGDDFVDTTGSDGTYTIAGVPAGTYPKLAFFPAAGFDQVVNENVTVPAGGTTVQDAVVRRDWSAASGGALLDSNDDTGAPFGCGHDQLIDQSLGVGWSPFQADAPEDQGNEHLGVPPTATIELPETIDISAFGMDPGFTCGDDETATTRLYRVETSADGTNFAVAKEGEFTVADAGRLNIVTPDANFAGVKFVRLTLLEPISEEPGDSGELFIDFSELEVFGGPPNTLPEGALNGPVGAVNPGQAFVLKAAFTDADSKITGYDWDFDANGTVDRTTEGPETTHSYAAPGTYTPRVAAKDFRGGAGSASTNVIVAGGGPPPPPPPPPPGPPSTRPGLLLPDTGRRGRARFGVFCDSACAGTARLTLSRRSARKLGLSRRLRGTARVRLAAAGQRRITIRLSRATLRAMRREKVRSLNFRLSVTVTDAQGQRRTSTSGVSIRRN